MENLNNRGDRLVSLTVDVWKAATGLHSVKDLAAAVDKTTAAAEAVRAEIGNVEVDVAVSAIRAACEGVLGASPEQFLPAVETIEQSVMDLDAIVAGIYSHEVGGQ